MELCPKCGEFSCLPTSVSLLGGKMTAERNHYTKKLKCYNINCSYNEHYEDKEPVKEFDWWNDFG